MLKIFKKRPDKKLSKLEVAKRFLLLAFLSASILFCLLLPRMPFWTTTVADFYSGRIFPIVSLIGISFCNMFFTSLTECIVVVGSFILLILIVLFIIKFVKNIKIGRGRRFFCEILTLLLVIALIMTATFELMHGLNYRRTSIAQRFDIVGDEHTSYDDYCAALEWAYTSMIKARNDLGTGDYNNVTHMMTNFEEVVREANDMISFLNELFGLGISRNYVRAKPVALSRLWSTTGIVGVYDTFIGEANVNTDYMDILDFPTTVCHEIAHARGYAREYDANTLAVIACISSSRPDFRYAGYYDIFCNLYNIVTEYSQHENREMYDYFSDPAMKAVIADMRAQRSYWQNISDMPLYELIHSTSEQVNNAYLEANGQEGGTETYHVDSNIYVNFYFKYVCEDT